MGGRRRWRGHGVPISWRWNRSSCCVLDWGNVGLSDLRVEGFVVEWGVEVYVGFWKGGGRVRFSSGN